MLVFFLLLLLMLRLLLLFMLLLLLLLHLLLLLFLLLLLLLFLFIRFNLLALFILFFFLLLTQKITLRLITCKAIVGSMVREADRWCLEVLEVVLLLVHLKLTAFFCTMNTFARLSSHSSFHLLGDTITISQTLEGHPPQALDKV